MGVVDLPAYGWTVRAYQKGAWNALTHPLQYKESCLAWHRRSGKDELGMHSAAVNAMRRVGNYWHMLPKGEQCRRAIWEAINPRTGRTRWKDAFPPEIIKSVDNQSMLVTFVNGSTWQLMGSDNYDNIVGSSPVGIFYSEAALANPAAFGFFRPILRENNGYAAYVSSVRGRNHFYRLYESLAGREDAFRSHLSAHDTGVFDKQTLEDERKAYVDVHGSAYGNALFEQEYLSNWDTAVVGAVWGDEIAAMRGDGRVMPCKHDPRYPVLTSWDLGFHDLTVILFWQMVGSEIRLIDWYADNKLGIQSYVSVLENKPYFYTHHIAPHDGAYGQTGTGESVAQTARRFGVEFTVVNRVRSKLDNVAYGADVINNMIINVSDSVTDSDKDCKYILDAISQYHFKYDETRKALSALPDHDWTSHYADALATFGNWLATTQRGRILPRQTDRVQRMQGTGAQTPAVVGDGRWDNPAQRAARYTAMSL